VCANGHPQLRPGAKFCYLDGSPVSMLGKPPSAPIRKGPLINGRYQTVAELGRGGMGSVVYRVADVQSGGREFALKEIDETQLQPAGERPEIVKAFQREANLLRRLDHANIVKVYDSFQIDIKHYMVMDLVLGKMLEDLLETSPGGFPEARVLEWAEQLCDALSYLHSQTPPIIYRDLKPQNVMVEDAGGAITIIDFGIAREFKGGKKKGDTIKFGTEGYAPPEQYGKGNVETSSASDVYAFGAMLHQLLSGKDPTQNPFNFDFLILSRPPISASPRVIDALKRALDNLPQKRFQTIDEFRQALTGLATPKAKKSPSPAAGAQSQSQLPMSGSHAPSPVGGPPLSLPSWGGGLQLSATQLDLGHIEKGGLRPAPRTFTVTSLGLAQISARENWLVAMPSTVSSGGLVEVSVQTDHLPLCGRQWRAPDLVRPVVNQLRRIPRNAWWVIAFMLLLGLAARSIWPVAILVIGGWLGLHVTLWLASQLLARVVAVPTDLAGQVFVADGPIQKIVDVRVKAVPSQWRSAVGWLISIAVVGGVVASILVGLAWLIQQLG